MWNWLKKNAEYEFGSLNTQEYGSTLKIIMFSEENVRIEIA